MKPRKHSSFEIVKALRDENPKVRRKAAQLLGERGHDDKQAAITVLTNALNDEDKTVRRYP